MPNPRSAQVAAAPGKRFNLKVNSLISFLPCFGLLECEAAVQIIASSLCYSRCPIHFLESPGSQAERTRGLGFPSEHPVRAKHLQTVPRDPPAVRRTCHHGPRPPVTPPAVGRLRLSRPPRARKGAPSGSAWHRARHTDSPGFVCMCLGHPCRNLRA